MENALEDANHCLSLCMRRNDFVVDLLKMILLRQLAVEAIKAFGLYHILKSNDWPIINKVSLHKQLTQYFNQKYGKLFIFAKHTWKYENNGMRAK